MVLPQIRALESKGKLAIVNPQRCIGCAALMPQCLFARDHCNTVLIWDVGPGLAPARPSQRAALQANWGTTTIASGSKSAPLEKPQPDE
jgi:hypothetical protein